MTADIIKQNFELKKENAKLKAEIKRLSNNLSYANNKIKQLEATIEKMKQTEEERIEKIVNKVVLDVTKKLNAEHEKEVNKLNAKISRLEKRLSIDSSNSGTPTSKNPIGKHIIQNNREKTDKPKGAEKGHKIHKLEYFKDDEITDTVVHNIECCPKCNGKLEEINEVTSDIIDIKVTVTKTRNIIKNYKCCNCKCRVSSNDNLPRGVSYGDNINAICLSMMNETNSSLNKVTSLISGLTDNQINLSEGYLIKLQKKCVKKLDNFIHDLKEKIYTLSNVHWDDTTVNFGLEKPDEGYDDKDKEYLEKIKSDEKTKDKKVREGVIRFYGDDQWALLIGHRNKNKESVKDDGILENLPSTCTVMHDHLLINYNIDYSFRNVECNEHIKRYLKKNLDMFPEHAWASQMRKLLMDIYKEKNDLIIQGINSFSEEKLEEISTKYEDIISLGYTENNLVNLAYVQNKIDELNLIERLEKFKENHLLFAFDFSVPFSNNTAERGLRQVKRKLAVSFMFKNANRMKDYATMISYLETCYRNEISRYDAAKRLASNNPYTIEELTTLATKNIS